MRILISQRVDFYPDRGERRDALDQAWGATLELLAGQRVSLLALPNRPSSANQILQEIEPDLLVLSGGNDIGDVPERDQTEAMMLQYAWGHNVPVLAVCRGMQMIQHFLGGSCVAVAGHVAVAHPVHVVSAAQGPALLRVNSYHTRGILATALADGFEPIYLHEDGSVEAARHAVRPWLAVMWHPERTALGDQAAGRWLAGQLQELL
jgi:putative glutamine amidotransferase